MCVSARADRKTNHSVLSYAIWEALGQPTLKPITYGFTISLTTTKQYLGFVFLIVTIQDQPIMSCTFYVANMCETIEDVTLGWFWMCQIDYHMDDKINIYFMKVNSLILTGEKRTREPIRVLKVPHCFFLSLMLLVYVCSCMSRAYGCKSIAY